MSISLLSFRHLVQRRDMLVVPVRHDLLRRNASHQLPLVARCSHPFCSAALLRYLALRAAHKCDSKLTVSNLQDISPILVREMPNQIDKARDESNVYQIRTNHYKNPKVFHVSISLMQFSRVVVAGLQRRLWPVNILDMSARRAHVAVALARRHVEHRWRVVVRVAALLLAS